jgi:lysyl-tRNA synthetase class I
MSRRLLFSEFLENYKKTHEIIEYEFDESTFVDSHTPMRIICNKHGEFWKSPKNIMKYDCWKCSYEKRGKKFTLTTEQFIEKAKKIHGNRYDYSESIYEGTKIPLTIICDKHGRFKQTPNDHLNGKGCPVCNESHLEKKVKIILNENDIKFIYQYKPNWLGKQSIDFFLPEYNIVIECQGKQHFGYGGWYDNFDFNKLYELDTKKYNLIKEHNIKIIYVSEEKYLNTNIEIYKDNLITIDNLIKCIHKNK